MTDAFPLLWPTGWPRTARYERKRARFGKVGESRHGWKMRKDLTVADALNRLRRQVEILDGGCLVVSSDMPIRRDGYPMSGRRTPDDPGVAVYFDLAGQPHCLPCDRWDRLADNIAAVAAHIDAVRAQERYGVGDIARAFAGFVSLPPSDAAKPWHEVLGLEPTGLTRSEVIRAYREKARRRHPDVGGTDAQMAELNAARDEALRRFGA